MKTKQMQLKFDLVDQWILNLKSQSLRVSKAKIVMIEKYEKQQHSLRLLKQIENSLIPF